MRTIAEVQALLADNASGDIGPSDIRDVVASLDDTGWAQYADTQYTSGAPFSVVADTDTIVPNNGLGVLDSQKPSDVVTFYDGSVITGRFNDGITVTVDLSVVPTSAGTTLVEFWFDIGGGIPPIYPRLVSFPKGSGVTRPINFTVTGYTLDTWEANGATLYCRGNGPFDIYNIRYVITRTHRGSRR